MARAPKGTPTRLNLSVLKRYVAERAEFPNQIDAVSVPHMMRCFKAGLVEIVPGSVKLGRPATESMLRLTNAGIEAIKEIR